MKTTQLRIAVRRLMIEELQRIETAVAEAIKLQEADMAKGIEPKQPVDELGRKLKGDPLTVSIIRTLISDLSKNEESYKVHGL